MPFLLSYYTIFIVIVKGFLESFLFFFLVVVSRWYQRTYGSRGCPRRPNPLRGKDLGRSLQSVGSYN